MSGTGGPSSGDAKRPALAPLSPSPAPAVERADVRATVWLTPTIDTQVRARMASEGRRSVSDFLRAMIVRGLGRE